MLAENQSFHREARGHQIRGAGRIAEGASELGKTRRPCHSRGQTPAWLLGCCDQHVGFCSISKSLGVSSAHLAKSGPCLLDRRMSSVMESEPSRGTTSLCVENKTYAVPNANFSITQSLASKKGLK